MQALSQADATISELRLRMGDDVGLLSYLPDEKVLKAPFHYKAVTGGHPLPIRILFGKLAEDKSPPREIWALLHNKPGSSRPPKCRLKIFSSRGELGDPITLEEAMDAASPTAAFTCLKAPSGRLDRAHISSVLRYYFILQRVELPLPWPISEIFVFELKSACRIAKANAEDNALSSRGLKAGTTDEAQPSNSMAPQRLQSLDSEKPTVGQATF